MDELKNDSIEDAEVTVVNNSPMLISCPACGTQVSRYAPSCVRCGQPINSALPQYPQHNVTPRRETTSQQQIIIQQPDEESNGVGTAGFVLSLIAFVLSWVPGVGWVVWFVGFLLSFFGMFSKPRALAIVGFLISIIDLLILVAAVGAISALVSALIS